MIMRSARSSLIDRHSLTPSRAQGRPGVGLAHGPPAEEKQAAVTTGLAELAFLRGGWNGVLCALPVRRAFGHRVCDIA
jgi:hypothetical protein